MYGIYQRHILLELEHFYFLLVNPLWCCEILWFPFGIANGWFWEKSTFVENNLITAIMVKVLWQPSNFNQLQILGSNYMQQNDYKKLAHFYGNHQLSQNVMIHGPSCWKHAKGICWTMISWHVICVGHLGTFCGNHQLSQNRMMHGSLCWKHAKGICWTMISWHVICVGHLRTFCGNHQLSQNRMIHGSSCWKHAKRILLNKWYHDMWLVLDIWGILLGGNMIDKYFVTFWRTIQEIILQHKKLMNSI